MVMTMGVSRTSSIIKHGNLSAIAFCPEDFAFGTPLPFCSIHGGDRYDLLDGKRRVLTTEDFDWIARAISAAPEILNIACKIRIELCLLLDLSPSFGSCVVYDGTSFDARYRRGHGIASEELARHGLPNLTHSDDFYLEQL